MIDEALSEIGKTPNEFYGYIDSWIDGDTVVVRVLKQHENEHLYNDPLLLKLIIFVFMVKKNFSYLKLCTSN